MSHVAALNYIAKIYVTLNQNSLEPTIKLSEWIAVIVILDKGGRINPDGWRARGLYLLGDADARIVTQEETTACIWYKVGDIDFGLMDDVEESVWKQKSL